MIEFNPLNVLDERKLDRIPPHFSKTRINELELSSNIENWIMGKCKGRFAFGKDSSIDGTGRSRPHVFVGFENEKELTFFMLACPYLRR
jgi:hypothetical protein